MIIAVKESNFPFNKSNLHDINSNRFNYRKDTRDLLEPTNSICLY